jgi:hypothetical protein
VIDINLAWAAVFPAPDALLGLAEAALGAA